MKLYCYFLRKGSFVQESILNTAQQQEEKINVEELETVLQSDIEEVVKLCKKACLKPKTDSKGNAYFTKDDVSMLKKMKELFNQSQNLSSQQSLPSEDMLQKKVNFLERAKNRIKSQEAKPLINTSVISNHIQTRLDNFEKNIIDKMSAVLSEKMDGFDEIIVELIRSKTENENLRQQVNSLNKQVYILKNELASFSPVAFGFYTRSETKDI